MGLLPGRMQARTDPDRHNGLTIFMVDRESPGLAIRKTPKMGSRCVSLCELTFEDVRVPAERIIGGPGEEGGLHKGWYHMMASLDMARVMVAISHVSLARKAYEDALAYAKIREQFGRVIAKFQAIQWQLVDMTIDIEAGRNLAYKAAWRHAHGEAMSMEGSIAKVFCTETAFELASDAIQILGGMGLAKEMLPEMLLRDARAAMIEDGANEVLALTGFRYLLQ